MSGATVFFDGSIPEAIQLAQRSHKLFLVYIANDGEEARKLEETTWTDSRALDIIRQNAVAVRLKHDSPDASHFSAMYPCSGIPCITIIGYEGVNILQRVGYVSGEELAGLVQQAMNVFNVQLQQAAARTMAAALLSMKMTALPNNNVETASTAVRRAQGGGEASTSAARETVKQEPDSTTAVEPSTSAARETCMQESDSSSPPPVEPMVASGEGEQHSILQHDQTVLRTSDEEMETTTSAPTILDVPTSPGTPGRQGNEDKQGEEGEAAEQASPQAMSEDESVHHESPQQVEKAVESRQAPPPPPAQVEKKEKQPSRKQRAEAQKPEPKPLRIPEKISLQVKLTDGTAIRGEFNKLDDLWTVKSYVDANRTDGGGNYNFAVPFPRKVFTAEEYETPLIDLGIGYRAALILVPTKDNKPIRQRSSPGPSSPSSGGSSVGRWLSFLNPLSYIRGSEAPKSPPNSPPGAASSSDSGDGKSGKLTKRKSWGANIHTLKHDEEDMFKKGNAYWNGNSTEFGSNDDKDK